MKDATYNLNGGFKPTTKRFADIEDPDDAAARLRGELHLDIDRISFRTTPARLKLDVATMPLLSNTRS